MWVMLGISICAGSLFFHRLFHLHRAQIKSADFLNGIFTIWAKGNTVEAISQCEDTPGPVAQMVRVAILEQQHGPARVRQMMEEVGLAEIPRLERHLPMLLTLAQIAPLTGLLGTVMGMMTILQRIEVNAPTLYAGDLSGGLWEAMLTTAAGIVVAIPVYAGYNFLVNRVESIILDMERAFAEIMLRLPDLSIRRED